MYDSPDDHDSNSSSSGASVEPPWEDLASRKAGYAADQQARALRSAAPVRTLLARVLLVKTDERAWRIGAQGESKVGKLLTGLTDSDSRWRAIHAVPVGTAGSDIDHVVIGPAGVFTLNTKNHPDAKVWVAGSTFMVNGHRQPYIRNSRFEAQRAAKLLTKAAGISAAVTGVVVVMGAQSLTVKEPPNEVCVVARRRLVDWLRAQPPMLTVEDIDRLFEAARRSTTWQASSMAPNQG